MLITFGDASVPVLPGLMLSFQITALVHLPGDHHEGDQQQEHEPNRHLPCEEKGTKVEDKGCEPDDQDTDDARCLRVIPKEVAHCPISLNK